MITAPLCPSCRSRSYFYDELRRVPLADYQERIYFRAKCKHCGRVERLVTEASALWDAARGDCHEGARNAATRRKLREAKCEGCGKIGRARSESYVCGLCEVRWRVEKAERELAKWRSRYEKLRARRTKS